MFTPCAGLAVHQQTVMACRVPPEPTGQPAAGILALQAFGAMTRERLAWSAWWAEVGVTHVAMGSTGEYRRPIYNLLGGSFTVLLVNAAPVTQVPGRQTDQADARWLAERLRYGLRAASFIPPQGPRDWRELTRDRAKLLQGRRRAVNRVQGVPARANSKVAAVATAIMGVSARASLAALMPGRTDPATRAELATGRLRPELPLLGPALTGLRRAHHRRLLTLPLAHSDVLGEQIDALRVAIRRSLSELERGAPPTPPGGSVDVMGETGCAADPRGPGSPLPFVQAVSVLATMPGVDQRGAERLVAEWGTDMRRVGTASRLSAWTGVAPGHDERAGKQRSGKTRRGRRLLRTGLAQLAHAAARTKGTSLAALYQRLASRRGRTRALMAVAHAIVVRAFPRLSRHEPYREGGAHYGDEQRRGDRVDHWPRRSRRLGYAVHLEPLQTA